MKKLRLMLSTFCLLLALITASGTFTKAFASGDDPQGGSRSTQTTPQPPPPPSLWDVIAAALATWF